MKEGAMDNRTLVQPSSFCWNASCRAYGQVDLSNIRKYGRTPGGVQRYQCTICHRTFVETIGTVFYGRRRPQETIIECLALLAERNSLAAIHRVKGVKEETVMEWLRIAAAHVERIEALLLANYKLSRAQLDAMWAYVGNKGEKGAMPKPMSAAPSGAA
jgi:transposase-like protein